MTTPASAPSSLPIHIPLVRTFRTQHTDAGNRLYSTRCSCGHWGPYVDTDDTVAALVREHAATDPAGCADCGHVTPADPTKPPNWQAPWRRYLPLEEAGVWRYVCLDQAACHQRQLAPSGEEPDDPLTAVIGGYSDFRVSLDLSGDWAQRVGHLDEAIANFQHVRAHCPRRWDQIDASDRRALTALVSAVAAVEQAVDVARYFSVLPALKAGATWADLAAAAGDSTAEECRSAYLARVEHLDWPEKEASEIEALLAQEPPSGA